MTQARAMTTLAVAGLWFEGKRSIAPWVPAYAHKR